MSKTEINHFTHFLVSEKQMEQCFADPDAGKLDVISVVVGGINRAKTIAALFKVWANDTGSTEVEMKGLVIDSYSSDLNKLALYLANWIKAAKTKPHLVVDGSGVGTQFIHALKHHGVEEHIREVFWGNPCESTANQERYFNQRAQCSAHAARAARLGQLRLPVGRREELIDQAVKMPFRIDDKDRYHVMPREQARVHGLPSPDLWDTVCLAYLEGVVDGK